MTQRMRHWEPVISVETKDNHILLLTFKNGEKKTYDMENHFNRGVFKALKNPIVFNKARIDGETVVWPFGLDISPEELYWNGKPL